MRLTGIHHLSALTADISGNIAFYTQTLGLRLVKKTVNQDDTSSYHLFYADGRGSPGSDLTFFDWPMAAPERRGTSSIVRTGLRVPGPESLRYWRDRLHQLNVLHGDIGQRDGRLVLDFEDPESQRLSLVADEGQSEAHPWSGSPVPEEHQIRGLGPITISVPRLGPSEQLLTELMQMHRAREYALPGGTAGGGDPASVHVFEMAKGGPAAELHVAVEPGLGPARYGRGGVHHVAFRIPTFEEYDQWAARLNDYGIGNSGPVDRFYFRSLYFREPAGSLFELATDGPGFTADEAVEELGQKLSLPPFLETRRRLIEGRLRPL